MVVCKLSRISIKVTTIMVFLIIIICPQVIYASNAQTTEDIGIYDMTMYLDGAFTGKTTLTRHSTSGSITTYFGTYSGGTHVSRSDTKFSHSSKGYVRITNWNSYSDAEGNLVKSESTWTVRITGYQQVTFTSVYEYGNYDVLQDTDTVYEETYTMRYYDNGAFDEETECRDVLTAEEVENKNGIECLRLRTNSYENSEDVGYSLFWVDEDGKLIQQDAYDESNNLVLSMKLTSSSNDGILPFILIVGAVILIGAVAVFFYMRKKNQPVPVFREQRKSPAYWEREYETKPRTRITSDSLPCNNCGMRIPVASKFCTFCGKSKVEHQSDQVTSSQTTKCSRCARPVPSNSQFCPFCGKQVNR